MLSMDQVVVFLQAIGDFDAALKIRPAHKNANKYMIETQVAQARIFVEEGKTTDAREILVNVIARDPEHKEAKSELCRAMIISARSDTPKKS